jgi:allophanate hydrolase subunit 2
MPNDLRPRLSREVDVRVVMGLYDYRLTDKGLSALLDQAWQLTTVADRIGFRYSGGALDWIEREQPFGAGSNPSNITDAGYPVGSIQVPGGIEPIILHRDAVSGGGYAMVATVISADMDVVAQCSPGTQTRFRPVSLDDALEARAVANERRKRLLSL